MRSSRKLVVGEGQTMIVVWSHGRLNLFLRHSLRSQCISNSIDLEIGNGSHNQTRV